MLNDFSLVIQMLWSTRSKAFLKSIKRLRTEPPLSRVVNHLCWIAISACVVDLPGREPNWPSSNTDSRVGINQSLTMPSRILAMVGNSEMDHRSFDIEVGGRTLGIGTTSADFHIGWKYRSLVEVLKIAASSWLVCQILWKSNNAFSSYS